MRRLALLGVDLGLVALSTGAALALRDNFVVSEAKFEALLPYLLISVAVAAIVLPTFGTTRSVWRFSVFGDYVSLVLATALTVFGAVALGFAVNRMEGVARALPILQALLMAVSLVGVRILMRVRHTRRGRPTQLVQPQSTGTFETVLVVGLSNLAELYLRSLASFVPQRIRVGGLLGRTERHTGRLVHNHPVLGAPEDIDAVLKDLEVHGVSIDRVVVAMAFKELSARARSALLELERASSVRVDFLAERLGLEQRGEGRAVEASASQMEPTAPIAFSIPPEELNRLACRPYWSIKRALDVLGALALLILTAPIMLAVAVLVGLDVGRPLVFWQQRPGLGGRPFKLFKFRTMAGAHDASGVRRRDDARVSVIGRLLRRTRLDELPQLLNILKGDMSFIGPRPLLPIDQAPDYAARLLVRPGLTGWAQVKGGREVSAADKAALDVWYVRHASLALDLEIALRTVPMVIFGERTNAKAIRRAWQDLRAAGICVAREAAADVAERASVSVAPVAASRRRHAA